MMNCLSLIFALFALIFPAASQRAPIAAVDVSIVQVGQPGLGATHGWNKIQAALSAGGIRYEEVSDPKDAHGQILIAASLSSTPGFVAERIQALGIKMPEAPESLIIHKTEWQGKQLLLLSGRDDRGLMYALLEVADRIGWTKVKSAPLSEVRDTVESPNVANRGMTIFTMQKHQFEDRLHNEDYWAKYFDMLADDRFNTFKIIFGYETNGYMCPAYPYFINVDGFPEVKVTGVTAEEQQQNRADLHRLIDMAHARGIRVELGIWCHYYRYTGTWTPVDHSKAIPNTVTGLSDDNMIPYTQAAIGQFLREYHDVDGIQLLMHDESGLKTSNMEEFWKSIYRVLKQSAPDMQYDVRAKGVSDDLINYGLSLGLKIRVNTKFWAEQVGLPFSPTHIQPLNQFERRHGYSDMFKYPRTYKVDWTLWTSGTTRILLWGDPDYVRRFAGSTHLGGVDEFDIMEPLATKMAGHSHDLKPFDLLSPSYRYYDYEFQRYWNFFQLFGRLTYDPNTPPEEWDREFVTRFGKDTAPYVEQGLQRASQILPMVTAYCLTADHFPTTRGWSERQRQDDLPDYIKALPSDTMQFQSMNDAADYIIQGLPSPRRTPMETSQWFAHASSDVRQLIAQAEQHAGPHPSKEFASTIIDLKILSDLAAYHSHRIPAGLSYALFEKTHDLNALDDAIAHEKQAIDAWSDIVHDAGDAYNSDLMMGLPSADLSGHWRDELVKLNAGLATLEKQRADYHLEVSRVVGRYDLGTEPLQPGYERVTRGTASLAETNGSNLVALNVPNGQYRVTVGIQDDKASHGPMWIEVNGAEYSDIFTVPQGQHVERTIETTAIDGKLKVLFDNATSADWYASTLVLTRIDPVIAHVPVSRLAPAQDLTLRATVEGIAPIASVRVYYGDASHGFTTAEMHGDGPLYSVTIPASKIAGGTSYFLEAVDTSGRMSTFPQDGSSHAIPVMVTGDTEPPTWQHTPILTAEPGQPLRITAKFQDPSGVKWVHLLYRGLSQHQDYQVVTMLPTGNDHEFTATVPGSAIDPHFDFMYFFAVMDNAGNGKLYPDMAKETPYIVVKVDHSSLEAKGAGAPEPAPQMQR
jgi:hypothetical protein